MILQGKAKSWSDLKFYDCQFDMQIPMKTRSWKQQKQSTELVIGSSWEFFTSLLIGFCIFLFISELEMGLEEINLWDWIHDSQVVKDEDLNIEGKKTSL